MLKINVITGLLLSLTLPGCGGEKLETAVNDRSTAGTVEDAFSGSAPVAPQAADLATGPASITDVIVITGQSNALGSETTFDPVLDQPVDRFYAYTDQGWQLASLDQTWDLTWHPRQGLDGCLLYTSPSPRDQRGSRMPSSA